MREQFFRAAARVVGRAYHRSMAHAPGVTVHRLPPASRLKRNALPVYEVRLNGKRIGRVETVKLGGARNLFYFAYGLHPEDGRDYRLEGNTDFDERVDVVRRFHLKPEEFSQHLGKGSYG